MTSRPTARERRAGHQADESREFARMVYETSVTQADIARDLGIAPSKVGRWCDPESRELPTVADIACMPEACRVWYLRRNAEREGRAVGETGPGSDHGADHLGRLRDLAKEQGELLSALAAAIADGVISPDEARAVKREACDVLEQAMGVANAMAEIERARGAVVQLKAVES